jgi:hypothetical protein
MDDFIVRLMDDFNDLRRLLNHYDLWLWSGLHNFRDRQIWLGDLIHSSHRFSRRKFESLRLGCPPNRS